MFLHQMECAGISQHWKNFIYYEISSVYCERCTTIKLVFKKKSQRFSKADRGLTEALRHGVNLDDQCVLTRPGAYMVIKILSMHIPLSLNTAVSVPSSSLGLARFSRTSGTHPDTRARPCLI